jgi:hypothetical protein
MIALAVGQIDTVGITWFTTSPSDPELGLKFEPPL